MAKIKKKAGISSENANKKEKKKKLNPFEVHVNKEKLKVLGKKSKNDKGLPGISREKAINKRKNTLLQEYKLQNKSNKFIDKRIGEKDKNLTAEDRFIARYAKIRARSEKKSRFNLADEVLTHRGQVLSEIEKFEDNRSDDDSDDERKGALQPDFVEQAHFGGGIFNKGTSDGAKSHKNLIDQLISESKKRKAEKQKLKEQTLDLTERLDAEWKDLVPLVSKSTKNDSVEKPKVDDFDKIMRELKFEARGHPSDRLKTEEEIANEEKEKLEKLEQERLQRMHGFSMKETTRKHRSADDLDENFHYEEAIDIPLSYNLDGMPNLTVNAELNGKPIGEDGSNCESEQESNIQSGNSDDEEESFDEDNISDLKEESENSDISDIEADYALISPIVKENQNKTNSENTWNQPEEGYSTANQQEILNNLLQRKEMMEKAREELPYTFTLPQDYETLQNLLIGATPESHNIIVERMIKCNHPSLDANNKDNLSTLFIYLLQYLNDISQRDLKNSLQITFRIFYNLLPHLYDLAHLNSESTHKAIIEVLKEKHMEYRKNVKKYPGIEVLLFLKLVVHIFSTSDFKHSVVTPCFVFIDQMLMHCRVRASKDVVYGLFLCTLVFEYTTLSKRFLPSVINFLAGVFYLAVPKTGIRILKVCPPFRTSSNMLVEVNNYSEADVNLKLHVKYFGAHELNDHFNIQVFYLSLNLVEELLNTIQELPSNCEMLTNIETYLQMVPLNNYPEVIKKKVNDVTQCMENLKNNRNIEYLTVAKPRPKALRLYEPNIEKIYDGKMHKSKSKKKAETDKLIHKLRKERKGALREIRRDQSFLAKVKIKKQIQSDDERKQKVKRLLAEASVQQSELNALDRKKKKK